MAAGRRFESMRKFFGHLMVSIIVDALDATLPACDASVLPVGGGRLRMSESRPAPPPGADLGAAAASTRVRMGAMMKQEKKKRDWQRRMMIFIHDGVPAVTVICDGGWSKRSHKHTYTACALLSTDNRMS